MVLSTFMKVAMGASGGAGKLVYGISQFAYGFLVLRIGFNRGSPVLDYLVISGVFALLNIAICV